MQQLAAAQSLAELKSQYRKLVSIHHPDRGGDVSVMQALNTQYELMYERFYIKGAGANDAAVMSEDFSVLEVGANIYINSTCCEVLELTATAFRVVVLGRSRQAWFDLEAGKGLYNTRLRASFKPIYPTTH